MKILERGTPKTYKLRCTSCLSLIEAERQEITWQGAFGWGAVPCPVCAVIIVVAPAREGVTP